MNKTLVLFSGGLDSTLALLLALKNNPPNSVTAASFKLGNNPMQMEKEIVARRRILEHLRSKGYSFESVELEVKFQNVPRWSSDIATATQPLAWAFMIPMAYNEYLEYSCIVAGYIKYDCFWLFREGWETMVKGGLMTLSDYTENTQENVMPRFFYPLRLLSKESVVKNIMDADTDLLKLVWWCQNETDKDIDTPCGKCPACEKLKQSGFTDLNDLTKHFAPEPPTKNPNQMEFFDILYTMECSVDVMKDEEPSVELKGDDACSDMSGSTTS